MPPFHTRLLVKDFFACFHFYRDTIGLNLFWGDENAGYASFSQEPGGPIVLALFNRHEMSEMIGTSSLQEDYEAQDRAMFIQRIHPLDEWVDAAKAKGLSFLKDPQDFPGWGLRAVYLRDPDGNLIEVNDELTREKWTEGLRQEDEKYH